MDRIEILGVYRISSPEPCHLIELLLHGVGRTIDLADFTQENENLPREYWQAPYLEHVLSSDGESIVARPFSELASPDQWRGDIRLAFFLHYLDLSRPLSTPVGSVDLPEESPLPERLKQVEYDPVD